MAVMAKIYLKVTAEHDKSGQVRSLFLTWTDGRKAMADTFEHSATE
jgi:hypothetical protein